MPDTKPHITTGKTGEDMAIQFVEKRSYQVLERNWRFSKSEVDIIASRGKTLHFFEVKTRRGKQQLLPEASVNTKKMNKLKEAATAYLFDHPEWKYIQFDILAITLFKTGEPEIFLIEDVY